RAVHSHHQPLSLHDALPISARRLRGERRRALDQVCSRTRIKLGRSFCLFQTRRSGHRPEAGVANEEIAELGEQQTSGAELLTSDAVLEGLIYLPIRISTPAASATSYKRKTKGPRFRPNPKRPSIMR